MAVAEIQAEQFNCDFIARRARDKCVPKASVAVAVVPESVRPAAVCHFLELMPNGHPQDIGSVRVDIVVLQHGIEGDGGDGFAVFSRDFDPLEVHFSVVEMRVFLSILVRADFVLSVQYPQLRLIPMPQKHLLLEARRAIDAASPTLRDSSDIEKIFEWQEGENSLEKFFCLEDSVACSGHCVQIDGLCDAHVRDV